MLANLSKTFMLLLRQKRGSVISATRRDIVLKSAGASLVLLQAVYTISVKMSLANFDCIADDRTYTSQVR